MCENGGSSLRTIVHASHISWISVGKQQINLFKFGLRDFQLLVTSQYITIILSIISMRFCSKYLCFTNIQIFLSKIYVTYFIFIIYLEFFYYFWIWKFTDYFLLNSVSTKCKTSEKALDSLGQSLLLFGSLFDIPALKPQTWTLRLLHDICLFYLPGLLNLNCLWITSAF